MRAEDVRAVGPFVILFRGDTSGGGNEIILAIHRDAHYAIDTWGFDYGGGVSGVYKIRPDQRAILLTSSSYREAKAYLDLHCQKM